MIAPLLLALAAAPAPPDCEALYAGGEHPRDLPRALS
jgi:hypothetical protein